MRAATRAELRKLRAQLPLRLLVLACLLAPLGFAALVRGGRGSPTDALFGVWAHSSGLALSLVVLGFAGSFGFPIIAGVLAGDLFAAEDRHGTWKTVLTRSRSLPQITAGKVVAAFGIAVALGLLVAVASTVAGLVLVGGGRFVDLAGHRPAGLHLFGLLAASWLVCLVPLLGYTSLALLCSAVARNGIAGVLGPVLVALLTQLLALIGKGIVVHQLLLGSAFDAWHGLFADPPRFGPLLVGLAVSLLWTTAALAATWRVVSGREFGAGERPHGGWGPALRFVGGALIVIAVLAVATNWGPVGVTASRLSRDLGASFRRLTVLQQDELGHPIPAGSHYRILPVCTRGGQRGSGPGDWSCTMNVYVVLPNSSQPLTDTPVPYDVTVASNGCYKALAPPTSVGGPQLRTPDGRTVVNPLAIVYGCVSLL